MRKRGLFLAILGLFFIVILVLIIRLSLKNSTLKYLSDDTRQIELLKTLTTSIVQEKIENKNVILNCDSEFYLNFVNNTAFVTSQKEELNTLMSQLSSEDSSATKYTVYSSFNLKTMCLSLKFEEKLDDDSTQYYLVTYKLGKHKSDNSISFKEKEFEIRRTGH